MSATTQQNSEEKLFFYYPGYNEEFPRRVLAGLQDGTKIHISEAVCFPGYKARLVAVPLVAGGTMFVVDPGMKADTFVKKEGKNLAINRVRGWKDLPDKSVQGFKRVYPGQQLICTIDFEGDHIAVVFHNDETAPILRVEMPDGLPPEGLSSGKAFVEGVEAYLKHYSFPAKPKKVKKSTEPQPAADSVEPTAP